MILELVKLGQGVKLKSKKAPERWRSPHDMLHPVYRQHGLHYAHVVPACREFQRLWSQ